MNFIYTEKINNTAYTYSDVLIKPQYSDVKSRSDVDLSTKIGHANLQFPIITSNMKTVTGPKMAATIAKFGGMGILHRFCTIEDNVQMYKDAINNLYIPMNNTPLINDIKNIGVSIGVKDEDKERFTKLYEEGARIFCIDVAHGHHIHVKNMLRWINDQLFLWARSERSHITLIAGNIATSKAYVDLTDWGADAIKVGIGPSNVCRTRYNTGVGVPQLSALEDAYNASLTVNTPISIIADGGVTHPADVAKALKFADAVMIGGMIAGTSESPGNVFRDENYEYYKVYGGSASGENKGDSKFVEGVVKHVKFKGKAKYIFREIKDGLQSAFSYVGAHNIIEFQDRCEFNFISNASRSESKI